MNSTLERLPQSRDVAAEIANHNAKARQLRSLWRLLRRIERERDDRKPEPQPCKS